jgi:hypothetical protein
VLVEFTEEDGLDEMKGIVAARSQHVIEQVKQYETGKTSLGFLALATGVDPVEAMLGLSEVGATFRVSHGLPAERIAATKAIGTHEKEGVIVDGPTLHIVRRLALENTVSAVCGPIGITQITLDNLRERLQFLNEDRAQPSGSLSYVNGQLQLSETSAADLQRVREVLKSDIAWLEKNADVLPALPRVEPPAAFRRLSQLASAKPFDDIYAASGANRLLLAEDMATRQLAGEMGVAATWLQPVLMIARKRGLLTNKDYARLLSDLSEIGEDFISADSDVLVAAYRLDCDANESAPGRRLRGTMHSLGGANAEPNSHADVVASFLNQLWRDSSLGKQKQQAASGILRRLLRHRTTDAGQILSYLDTKLRACPEARDYLRGWARGHFFSY